MELVRLDKSRRMVVTKDDICERGRTYFKELTEIVKATKLLAQQDLRQGERSIKIGERGREER